LAERTQATAVWQNEPNSAVKIAGYGAVDKSIEETRRIRLVGQPVTLSRPPSKTAARPPEFGKQTEEVLAEFGLGADEVAQFRQREVV
jgi:crotonobetainyl-CoA:carnitine CoA-transferase CaiB-like acyl-CoA transferase